MFLEITHTYYTHLSYLFIYFGYTWSSISIELLRTWSVQPLLKIDNLSRSHRGSLNSLKDTRWSRAARTLGARYYSVSYYFVEVNKIIKKKFFCYELVASECLKFERSRHEVLHGKKTFIIFDIKQKPKFFKIYI